jgi:phospholipase/lecithinase/hemolysin
MTTKKSVRNQILATGFAIGSWFVPLQTQAASFSQIVVFGDSLSETGNSFETTGIPPSPPYFQGRFSNGPVWIDYLADDLEISSDRRTNYAFGGATTGSDNNILLPTGAPSLPGLQQQLNSFTATNTTADPNALYLVWAGANDYLGGNITDPTVPVNNLTSTVKTLSEYGAKNVLVANLPDLGRIPATSNIPQIADNLNLLSEFHNLGLTNSLSELSQQTDTKIISLDVNSLFRRAIANPSEFGLTNVTDACLTQAGVCSNPNEYLFWDDFHPTTVTHELVSEAALSSLESKAVPEPTAGLGILALATLGAYSLCKGKVKI